jgi:hypothetical protein
MSVATIARLRRDVAMLSERVMPIRQPLTAMEVATRSGMMPDPWQQELLASDARQVAILASRQSGKSTTTSVLAAQRAAFVPGSLVLLLSPALRQAQELFLKVRRILLALDVAAPPIVEASALRVELSNGSRVVCLPGREDTIRGFSGVSLLLVDEAARVPDALYQAVRPMLAVSGGRLVLLSTPFGKRGFFHHEWVDGGAEWARFKVTADQCPRIDPVWLAKERATIGDWWFEQEYRCEFKETTDSVFRYDDITAALDPRVTPLFGDTSHAA